MITTNEFRKLLPRRLAEIEAAIDVALTRAAEDGRRSATFAARLIPADLRDAVMRRYEDVGWRVPFVADARDGDYLEFALP